MDDKQRGSEMMPDEPLVWLVTGCSSGFGIDLVRVALNAGHKVIASSRNPAKTPNLVQEVEEAGGKWIALDVCAVTGPEAVKDAVGLFGRIDVLVNNAGFGTFAPLEDMPAGEIRSQFDTNVFAPIELTRAVIPSMRKQGAGCIVNIGSRNGYTTFPMIGAYGGTKHAMEAISEVFGAELAPFGINVLLIEPGPFRTNSLGTDIVFGTPPSDPYRMGPVADTLEVFKRAHNKQPGDTRKAGQRIFELVTNTGMADGLALAWGQGGFLRVPLGKEATSAMLAKAKAFEETASKWADFAAATAHDE